MASGVAVSDDCVRAFENIKNSKVHRFAIFLITGKKIDVEQVGSRDASYDDFLSQLKAGEGKQCRYGVYDYEYTYQHQGTASVAIKQKLFLMLWCPDTASVTNKMIYASSYESLKQALVGIQKYIQANDDDEASQETVEEILRSTDHFEIISIDPFHIPILRLAPDLTRPVNIDFNMTNIDMFGLHKFNIYKISGFTQNINGANEIHLKGNRLNLIGKYVLHGQVLILPVVGNGDANVTIINPDIQLKFTGKPSVIDGKTYMQTEDMKVSFNVKKLVFQFDNLYNGDKILGATTLRFVNEYWHDIYLDIKPALVRTFEEEIQKIANDAMAKLPFDEYFLK
ncbi:hypothetical protein HA402_007476 [Bradysia odoriphaga]|nr:hypothetical protein HA402_007476 [Bradysia odoriphaga]